MRKEKQTPAPIRQSVHVDCPVEDAFRLFTEEFAEWWPRESCSVAGGESVDCAIEPRAGGKVFERSRSGEEHDWGSVTIWDPPGRLEFTWHPGARRDTSQTVTVDFCQEEDGTRVTVTHRGWYWAGAATCASRLDQFVSRHMLVAA